ncbi:hypothetical protein HOE425_332178 [Hoeflea sp. EC-HK425]|nr:hypothetical protein HOE425_332178 [Hoeflea sp. EC-HK425]
MNIAAWWLKKCNIGWFTVVTCFRILNESMFKVEYGKGFGPMHDAFPVAARRCKRHMPSFERCRVPNRLTG